MNLDLNAYRVCTVCRKPVTAQETDFQGRGACCQPKPPTWAISWQNRVTGKEGRGRPAFWTKEACQAACDNANTLFPTLLHWPIEEPRRA